MLPKRSRADEKRTSFQGLISSILNTIISKAAVPTEAALVPYRKSIEKIKLKNTNSKAVK
ncbi:hypothetical protein D3C87_2074630 [compost metagenome]